MSCQDALDSWCTTHCGPALAAFGARPNSWTCVPSEVDATLWSEAIEADRSIKAVLRTYCGAVGTRMDTNTWISAEHNALDALLWNATLCPNAGPITGWPQSPGWLNGRPTGGTVVADQPDTGSWPIGWSNLQASAIPRWRQQVLKQSTLTRRRALQEPLRVSLPSAIHRELTKAIRTHSAALHLRVRRSGGECPHCGPVLCARELPRARGNLTAASLPHVMLNWSKLEIAPTALGTLTRTVKLAFGFIVRDGEAYLERSLNSVFSLGEQFSDYRIFYVENDSRDATRAILRRCLAGVG